MYVSVIHTISDPESFWGTAGTAEFPEGITLHSSFPNEDGSKAVCLWEGGSVDEIKKLVEDTVGEVSSNEYFGVDSEKAQGLPS